MNRLEKSPKWLVDPRALWLAIFVELIVSASLMALPLEQLGWLVNVGFLLLGALLTITTVLLSDAMKRGEQGRDLARALYVELANRVARCCFDYERPWSVWAIAPVPVNSNRVRKFASFEPIIYPSTAGQIALLKGDAPQRLIQFYYHLAAWQRDVETTCGEPDREAQVEARDIGRLGYRLHQTLEPGLYALIALDPMVDGTKELDADAIAAFDKFRRSMPDGALRERLSRLAQDAPER